MSGIDKTWLSRKLGRCGQYLQYGDSQVPLVLTGRIEGMTQHAASANTPVTPNIFFYYVLQNGLKLCVNYLNVKLPECSTNYLNTLGYLKL